MPERAPGATVSNLADEASVPMRKSVQRPTVAALVVLIAGHAAPATPADPAEGRRLARQWCTSCHIVAPGTSGSDAARPFESVAKDPNFTEDGLRAWLADPHPPMPNLNLSRAEIDAIVAYIESLRGE
jgi:mono/diheme cytochrome c family protein